MWTSGPFVPVSDPCLTIVGPWHICGSFVDHLWIFADHWCTLVAGCWILAGPYWILGSFRHWAFSWNCLCHCRALRDLSWCELGNLCWFYWLEIGIGWKLGKMEDSPGSSHLEGGLLVAEAYPGGGLAYGSDTGIWMTRGEITAMIGMITARPEESGSDYAIGYESTVGSPLELAVALRQGQPSYPTEADTNMESAPWGYRSFERIRVVNQFGEAAERSMIHEWTPETHDLATLPAQVEELTGALNYLQNFNFEAVSAISEIRQVIQALSRELEIHARGVQVDGSALTAWVEVLGQLLNEVNNEVQDQRSQLDWKRAEMQSTLEQATAGALEYHQGAEALTAKVDNSRQLRLGASH